MSLGSQAAKQHRLASRILQLARQMAEIKRFVVAFVIVVSSISVDAQHIEIQSTVTMNSNILPDAEMDSTIAVSRAELANFMNETLGQSAETMAAVRPESALTRLLADMLLSESQHISSKKNDIPMPQIALLNIGGIRATLPKGNITRGNIFEIAPFENSIVILQITGAQLREVCNHIAQRGGEAVAGISFQIVDNQAINIIVDAQPISDDTIYSIATIDYLAHGGDGFAMFCDLEFYELQIRIRDAFIDYIKSHDVPIVAPTNVRISIIEK